MQRRKLIHTSASGVAGITLGPDEISHWLKKDIAFPKKAFEKSGLPAA
jgi:hypothetical protein